MNENKGQAFSVTVKMSCLRLHAPQMQTWGGCSDGWTHWVAVPQRGSQDGVPGSWPQPGPALAIVAIWRPEPAFEDPFTCLSVSLSNR